MRPDAAGGDAIADGDRVLVFEVATGRRWLLRAAAGAVKEKGLGVLDPGRFVGEAWGTRTDVAGKDVVLLRPRLPDLVGTLRRKAQIIQPKDASRIVYELGVGEGMRVLESGIGSGAATMALAAAVGQTGRVVVQELRDDFEAWAMANLERAGLAGRVEVHPGDLTEGLAQDVEGPFDAALLDQPEPWDALPRILAALAPGAVVACYCPQAGQMERSARAMRTLGLADVRCIELIERSWEIRERGIRPSHEGLGHTAFLVFGRFVE